MINQSKYMMKYTKENRISSTTQIQSIPFHPRRFLAQVILNDDKEPPIIRQHCSQLQSQVYSRKTNRGLLSIRRPRRKKTSPPNLAQSSPTQTNRSTLNKLAFIDYNRYLLFSLSAWLQNRKCITSSSISRGAVHSIHTNNNFPLDRYIRLIPQLYFLWFLIC